MRICRSHIWARQCPQDVYKIKIMKPAALANSTKLGDSLDSI